jgi:hypothetical protein
MESRAAKSWGSPYEVAFESGENMPCKTVATSEKQKIRNEPIYPMSLRNLHFIFSNIQPLNPPTDEPKSARNHWSFGQTKKCETNRSLWSQTSFVTCISNEIRTTASSTAITAGTPYAHSFKRMSQMEQPGLAGFPLHPIPTSNRRKTPWTSMTCRCYTQVAAPTPGI